MHFPTFDPGQFSFHRKYSIYASLPYKHCKEDDQIVISALHNTASSSSASVGDQKGQIRRAERVLCHHELNTYDTFVQYVRKE